MWPVIGRCSAVSRQRSRVRVLVMRPICILLALTACGPASASNPDAAVSVADGAGQADAPPVDALFADAPPPPDFSRVYAHSGQRLYRIDTNELAPVEIGPFTGIGTQSINDIAVDKDERTLGL